MQCLIFFSLFAAAPKVYPEPRSGLVVVKEGEPISIGCEATGDPTPVITWKKPVCSCLIYRLLILYKQPKDLFRLEKKLGPLKDFPQIFPP